MSWSGPGGAGLVGRAGEIVQLRRALDDVAAGRGRVGVLRGEAGIGKSSLIAAVLDDARQREMATFVGHAREVERDVPFAAVADLVAARPDLVAIADALRPVEHLTMADRTIVVADALADVLEDAAARGGAVVVVEDVHWADPGTIAVLRRIARSAPAQPMLILVTQRPTPAPRDLQLTLDELVDVLTIDLPGLPADAVDELVHRRAGRPPSPRLRDVLGRCAGNPFFVLALLSALEEADVLTASGAEADVRGELHEVPTSARDALVRHLRYLPPEAWRVLQVAALLGESFSARDLAAVLDRPVSDVLVQIDAGLASGLVVDDGARWRFRHDLVRQSLEEGLAPTARGALHHEIAVALRRAGARPATVARHVALSAEPGDREAVAALRTAAADALRSSMAVGVSLLESALELAGPTGPDRFDLVADLLDPLNASGRSDEAERLARGVLGRPMPVPTECTIVHGLASTLYATGDVAGAVATIAPMLERPDVAGASRAVLHAATAMFSLLALDMEAMVAHAAAAEDAAAGSGDDYAIGLAANTVAMARLTTGRISEAIEPAAAARRHHAAGSVYSWGAYSPPLTSALVAFERDELTDATARLAGGRSELEATGNVSWLVQYGAIDALVPYVAGDLDATEDACRLAQQLPLDYGARYQLGVPDALLALVAWRRGDLATAAAQAEQAERHYLEHGPQLGIDLAWLASALVKEASGDTDGAFELLRLAWELTGPIHAFVSLRIVGPEVARRAVGRDPSLSRRLADEAAVAAERNPVPSAAGTATLLEGLAADDADALVRAVDELARSPRPLATADAATDAVRLLRAAGRRDEARHVYELARERYVAAGATGDLDRLRRAAGMRRGAATPRPAAGWDSLTRSEREVVSLLQDGLTNRQIGDALGISRRTVETHLSHAFTKVGVTTRVQLAAAAARR